MIAVEVVTPATVRPLSVANIASGLQMGLPDETETWGANLVAEWNAVQDSALADVERLGGLAVMPQSLRAVLSRADWCGLPEADGWRTVELPRAPAASLVSVTVYAPDGTSERLATADQELIGARPGLRPVVRIRAGAVGELRAERAVAVTYAAGYADAASVPADLLRLVRNRVAVLEQSDGTVSWLRLKRASTAAIVAWKGRAA